jgi:hypothetical protein
LRIGDELELTADGIDQYGRAVELTDATWRAEGDGDGVVDPTDGAATIFTATAAGSAQLICTADGVDGTASVEITGAAPPAPRRPTRRVAP